MSYDSLASRMVLYAGMSGGIGVHDTWNYNALTNNWTDRAPSADPFIALSHRTAFDERAGRTILFAGFKATYINQTWAYDSLNNTWARRYAVVAPGPRTDPGMAYDARAGRVLIFGGGQGGPPSESNETWAFDFASNNWTNRAPLVHPSARSSPAMAYISRTARVLMFGGYSGLVYGDMWSYDYANNSWTGLFPASSPPARYGMSMTYDRLNDRVVLFGGRNATTFFSDTWVYDVFSNNWTQSITAAAPSPRVAFGMDYDAANGKVILFGGGLTAFDVNYGDTWVYEHNATVPADGGMIALAASAMLSIAIVAACGAPGSPLHRLRGIPVRRTIPARRREAG